MKRMLTHWTEIFEQFISEDSLPETWQRFLLVLIVLGVLAFRLLTINAPPLDRTAWKEIDYIMVSTNYWKHGFNFFRPEITWPAEPPRVTPMEFPLVPYAAALLYPSLGFSALSARTITLLAFLLLIFYMFRLTSRELGPFVGILAALASGIMPLYHPFGRFLFSEPMMIATSVMAIYHLAEWVDFGRPRDGLLFVLAFALTISLKLESLYLLLPIGWLVFRKHKWQLSAYAPFLLLITLALILPAAWYSYAYWLEETGVHAFSVFRGHDKFQTLRMLMNPGWYRTMGGRILRDVLGGVVGSLLCLSGLLMAGWRRKAVFFFAYLVAIGAYAILVAEGHIDAPYRQLTSIPPLSVFVALGATAIMASAFAGYKVLRQPSFSVKQRTSHLIVVACIALVLLLPTARYTYLVGDKGPAHWDRWEVAQVTKGFADEDSKIVTAGEYTAHVGGYDISPILYYYTGLQGWTLEPDDWSVEYVETLVRRGATHFVAMPPYYNPLINMQDPPIAPFLQEMKARYKALYESDGQLLLDLRQATNR